MINIGNMIINNTIKIRWNMIRDQYGLISYRINNDIKMKTLCKEIQDQNILSLSIVNNEFNDKQMDRVAENLFSTLLFKEQLAILKTKSLRNI